MILGSDLDLVIGLILIYSGILWMVGLVCSGFSLEDCYKPCITINIFIIIIIFGAYLMSGGL